MLNLFFPKVCESCRGFLQDNEVIICVSCRHQLPVTNFHFENDKSVNKILYGRTKLNKATALLHFSKKGMVQELLHNLKYRGHEQIGELFGKWLGAELKMAKGYDTIDAVVPVPLHNKKLKQRGYNQVAKFGKEIANALNADYVDTVLLKTTATNTQVFKDRLRRYDDTKTKFAIKDLETLKGKHILLVDDIITTGATIESCADVLQKIEGIKISVATMAIAD